jgi:hypothetical protein
MNFVFDASALRQRTYLLTIVFLTCAGSLNAQTNLAQARELQLQIQTDRSTYRVGDSIFVKLALRSVSKHQVDVPSDTPTGLALLRVRDEHGALVKTTLPMAEGMGSGPRHGLGVGKELSLLTSKKTSRGTATGRGSVTWMSLTDWGYRIQAPGRYTITGFPLVPVVEGAGFTFDMTTRSNEAEFTIQAK